MILDRHEAIKARQDAFGKVWGIRPENKENAFWIICIEKDNGDLVPPDSYPNEIMESKWTRQNAALEQISTYLEDSWNFAEQEQQKQVRKEHKRKQEDKEVRAAVG